MIETFPSANGILALADNDITMTLDQANADAVRLVVAQLADPDVINVYELTGGEGPVADLAADQMEARNLDY